MRGIKRDCRQPGGAGESVVMGVLQRLRIDAGCVETRVTSNLTCWYGGPVRLELRLASHKPQNEKPAAAATLCESLTQYMMTRLDDENGPVNRATALLDKETMIKVLEHEFDMCYAPKCEKTLLRMAVDWASQPWRDPKEILEVMGKIAYEDVPTRTLLHLDQGSGWTHTMVATNHQLQVKLLALVNRYDIGNYGLSKLIEAGLEKQRLGAREELTRECFHGDAPTFPTGQELHELLLVCALEKERLETRLRDKQAHAEALEKSIKSMKKKRHVDGADDEQDVDSSSNKKPRLE